jgi:hypothetical protein
MRANLHTCWLPAAALLISLCAFGCSSSQPSGRPDLDAIPREELHGASTKSMLYEFRAKVRKRGAAAAKQELPQLVESLQDYEKQPVGQHKETYKQIFDKIKSLETALAASPSKDAVVKAADEIGTLADKLPGKANPNPSIE